MSTPEPALTFFNVEMAVLCIWLPSTPWNLNPSTGHSSSSPRPNASSNSNDKQRAQKEWLQRYTVRHCLHTWPHLLHLKQSSMRRAICSGAGYAARKRRMPAGEANMKQLVMCCDVVQCHVVSCNRIIHVIVYTLLCVSINLVFKCDKTAATVRERLA